MRSTGKPDSDVILKTHKENTQDAARNVKSRLNEKTTCSENVIRLGLDDVADVLNEKVDEGLKKLSKTPPYKK